VKGDPNHAAILRFYGDRRARRSGIPLMNHIDEGLALLTTLGASLLARQAFCLHPIVQADADLAAAFADGSTALDGVDARPLALAMEYRSVANAYLSTRTIAGLDDIRLSPLADVNLMLVADKVQNRKDFERHHASTHPRAAELALYFQNWLSRLGVSEARYAELCASLSS
jgi:hypothetical protein